MRHAAVRARRGHARRRARSLLLLVLCSACVGYVPHPGLLPPADEVVRLSFRRPQPLVVERARGIPMGAEPVRRDTLRGITAVYGRLLTFAGDTVHVALTGITDASGRRLAAHRSTTRVAWASTGGVERLGYSPQRTTGLAVGLLGLVAAALAVLGRGFAT